MIGLGFLCLFIATSIYVYLTSETKGIVNPAMNTPFHKDFTGIAFTTKFDSYRTYPAVAFLHPKAVGYPL